MPIRVVFCGRRAHLSSRSPKVSRVLGQRPAPGVWAFTLVELLVSMAILVLLILLISQLFSAATTVTLLGGKHMDDDAQARVLLDRMAFDFGAMVKRSDVDYYLKGRPAANVQAGNDQIAFYSEIPGYYPSTGAQSPISLVAYRLNSTTYRVERMGKGLVWNGVSATDTPLLFLPVPIASPLPSPLPTPMPASAPTPAWPAAGNNTADADYEQIGPQVFRIEYFYLLKSGALSITPWDVAVGSTSVNGMQDVTSIGMAVAVIDPKSRVLVSDLQLSSLIGSLPDFAASMKPGDLEAQWQTAINASALPKAASSAIRVYSRYFPLTPVTK